MARWRLDVAYDGTAFAGWATQPGQRTVAGELERWTTTVLRLDEPATLVCAGRTDAGVHARGQVAHLDLPDDVGTPPEELARRLARVLPPDLVVPSVREAPAGFDARFAAVWRRYVYRLADERTRRDPLLRGFVQDVPGTLDLDRLAAVVPDLLGLRDFAAFCRRREGATTIRTLLDLGAERVAAGPLAGVVEVTVRADAFCHSMVRSLVGALVAVADGRRDRAWLAGLLDASAREPSVPVLPARGLTLEEVGYPADDALASPVARSPSRTGARVTSPEQPEHYFSGTPTGPEHRRRLDVEVWGRRFVLQSANGVFAADHLDRGTEILLRESAPPTGRPTVLDLGCGYGPVALGIALACPGPASTPST